MVSSSITHTHTLHTCTHVMTHTLPMLRTETLRVQSAHGSHSFLSLLLCFCPVFLLTRLGSVLASTVNVLATGLSIYLIERMGRRKLLLISTLGMMLSCVGLTFALQAMEDPASVGLASSSASSSSSPSVGSSGVAGDLDGLAAGGGAALATPPAWVGFMSVAMVLVFVSFFEVGLGPIPWLIGAEIFPARIRTEAMGISSTLNWLSNFAVGLSFPTISLALGPLSFVPFGVVLAFAFVLEYRFVPETQGKTLEEIQEEFLARDEKDKEKEKRGRTGSGGSGGDDGASSVGTPRGGGGSSGGAGFSDCSDDEEAGLVGDAEDAEDDEDEGEGEGDDEHEHEDQEALNVAIAPPPRSAAVSNSSASRSSSSSAASSAFPHTSPEALATPIPEEEEELNEAPSSASSSSSTSPAGGQRPQQHARVSRPRRGSSSGADDPVTEDDNEPATDESVGSSAQEHDEII